MTAAAAKAEPGASQIGVQTGARILLADDDPILREIACARLAGDGHGIVGVADGAAAWSELATGQFDLAIVDLGMPKVDGYALIEEVRRAEWGRHLPIMVVTCREDGGAVERAFHLGATTFVTKPLNWALFSHQVRYVLRSAGLEQELRQSRDQAESVNRLRAGLLTIVSHEFRTPLHSILGFSELLRRQAGFGAPAASVQEYARHIYEGGQRFCRALDDILTVSRLLSGDVELDLGLYSVRELVEEAAKVHADMAADRGIEFRYRCPAGEVLITCDRTRLQQALSALLGNAAKFSPERSSVEVMVDLEPDAGLLIMIADRGPGMPADKIALYMEPFVQADMSLGRSHEGLGLGLALAKGLIELHGGRLVIQSTPAVGTTVAVVIPAKLVSEGKGSEAARP